ncbi:hypothetical protein COU59_02020 [Candidatus Pacearchaeota archaeon CG10_big_fil_rev_8_21_14_0_10_34_12]|nr:MAG: hypothetical protein COU59_02020 [Candidatus Pacearchaeota archaeon CG10_big_fil_rev_8_21_14_0_10_34_12]
MIKRNESLSIPEAGEFVEKIEKNEEIIKFINDFTKMKPEKAKEMRKMIEDMGIMKLRNEQIIKVIDLMPETSEDLNKIFNNISLTEDETKNILDAVKKFK